MRAVGTHPACVTLTLIILTLTLTLSYTLITLTITLSFTLITLSLSLEGRKVRDESCKYAPSVRSLTHCDLILSGYFACMNRRAEYFLTLLPLPLLL